MKSVLQSIRSHDQAADVNMSPLIDVVFLLLIFFVVTTVFVEETGVAIDKPRAASAVDVDRKSIMLGLKADGRVVFGGEDISLGSVRGIVSRQMKEGRRSSVLILADRSASTGRLIAVIDECKLAGATTVNVAATAEGAYP